jgi:hypothetical protein
MLKKNTLYPCVFCRFKVDLAISYEKVPSKTRAHLLQSEP